MRGRRRWQGPRRGREVVGTVREVRCGGTPLPPVRAALREGPGWGGVAAGAEGNSVSSEIKIHEDGVAQHGQAQQRQQRVGEAQQGPAQRGPPLSGTCTSAACMR